MKLWKYIVAFVELFAPVAVYSGICVVGVAEGSAYGDVLGQAAATLHPSLPPSTRGAPTSTSETQLGQR